VIASSVGPTVRHCVAAVGEDISFLSMSCSWSAVASGGQTWDGLKGYRLMALIPCVRLGCHAVSVRQRDAMYVVSMPVKVYPTATVERYMRTDRITFVLL